MRLRDRLYETPGEWNTNVCRQCGAIWLDPAPSEQDILIAYRKYYTHSNQQVSRLRSLYSSLVDFYVRTTYGYRRASSVQRIAVQLAALFHPGGPAELGRSVLYLPKPSGERLLVELGSGSGEFLAYMRNLGWRVEGVEVDSIAVAAARARGLAIREGDLFSQRLPDSYADVVCLIHVVEHLHDPVATLRECRRILKDAGMLVIATPNSQALGHLRFGRHWVSLDPPRHLVLFGPTTLRELLTGAGFQDLRISSSTRGARSAWIQGRYLRHHEKWDYGDSPPSFIRHAFAVPFQLLERLEISRGNEVGEELVAVAKPKPD